MDDSSITNVQVDELNIEERRFSEHSQNKKNGITSEHHISHYPVLEPATSYHSAIYHTVERDISFQGPVVEQLSSHTQSGIYHTLEPDTLQ